jgi:hypothetical protein
VLRRKPQSFASNYEQGNPRIDVPELSIVEALRPTAPVFMDIVAEGSAQEELTATPPL